MRIELGSQNLDRFRPGLSLTLQGYDEGLSIFDELLDELVGFVQLGFMRFQPLSELGAVQAAVTKFQSRESHCFPEPLQRETFGRTTN